MKFLKLIILLLVSSNSYALDVDINLWAENTPKETRIYARTNLPDGTLLKVTFVDASKSGDTGNIAEKTVSVNFQGTIDIGNFKNMPIRLTTGIYILNLTSIGDHLQPENVKKIFGSKGKNLYGDTVKSHLGFKSVNILKNLDVRADGTVKFLSDEETRRYKEFKIHSEIKEELFIARETVKQIYVAINCHILEKEYGAKAIEKIKQHYTKTIRASELDRSRSQELENDVIAMNSEAAIIASSYSCNDLSNSWKERIKKTVQFMNDVKI